MIAFFLPLIPFSLSFPIKMILLVVNYTRILREMLFLPGNRRTSQQSLLLRDRHGSGRHKVPGPKDVVITDTDPSHERNQSNKQIVSRLSESHYSVWSNLHYRTWNNKTIEERNRFRTKASLPSGVKPHSDLREDGTSAKAQNKSTLSAFYERDLVYFICLSKFNFPTWLWHFPCVFLTRRTVFPSWMLIVFSWGVAPLRVVSFSMCSFVCSIPLFLY